MELSYLQKLEFRVGVGCNGLILSRHATLIEVVSALRKINSHKISGEI